MHQALPARIDLDGPSIERPICKGAFCRCRNGACSLVQRKRLSSGSPLLREKKKACAAIIFGEASSSQVKSTGVESSRVEKPRELSFAHLQTNWANGVKITGARRTLSRRWSLSCPLGHGSRGETGRLRPLNSRGSIES